MNSNESITTDTGLELVNPLERLKEEVASLKKMVEKADDQKGRMLLEKYDEEDAKASAHQRMLSLANEQEEQQRAFAEEMKTVQDKVLNMSKVKLEMENELKRLQDELESKKAEAAKLKQKFEIDATIPRREVKFTGPYLHEGVDNDRSIRGVFAISQTPTLLLTGGQAVIAFEDETVASQILKLAKCSVSCEQTVLTVKPKKICLNPTVLFEIHLEVPKNELKVTDIPAVTSEERTKTSLELSFCRASTGGGEVERVEYDATDGSAVITFLHTCVAENLAQRGKYDVNLNKQVAVKVEPIYKYKLLQFQTFCGTSKRTVLIDDIEDDEDVEDLLDYLEIHFQKPSNYGGEIECIKYIPGQKAQQAFFQLNNTAPQK
ncbi:N-myc-interactor [Synchiropus picturatus]